MAETAGARFERLVGIMRTLRGPQGCPWDREQTLASLRPFVLEETYELLEALDRGDVDGLREELGDFLYEAVFLAQIAEEDGHFGIGDAIDAIARKLISRHPHVFRPDGTPLGEGRAAAPTGDAGAAAATTAPGSGTRTMTAQDVIEKWEDLKAKERAAIGQTGKTLLSGVPRTLPGLLRAYELSARAAAVGFDWARAADVLDKIDEELAELRQATLVHGAGSKEAEGELGDLFFALANLSRKLGIEPEAALRTANDKFQRRFDALERRVIAGGHELRDLSLDELEAHWAAVKREG